MEKPKILYHASPTAGLKVLEPRNKSVRDKDEGPVVFATDSFAFALMFMSPIPDDSWTKQGCIYNEKGDFFWYYLIFDEQRFRQNDHGGVVYEVQSDTFYQEPNFGMKSEWVSKQSVPILKEHIFSSTLKALISHDVRVYFVDEATFQTVKEDTNKLFEIFQSHQPAKL